MGEGRHGNEKSNKKRFIEKWKDVLKNDLHDKTVEFIRKRLYSLKNKNDKSTNETYEEIILSQELCINNSTSNKEAVIAGKNRKIDTLLNSKSWKITYPLRQISAFFRKWCILIALLTFRLFTP